MFDFLVGAASKYGPDVISLDRKLLMGIAERVPERSFTKPSKGVNMTLKGSVP